MPLNYLISALRDCIIHIVHTEAHKFEFNNSYRQYYRLVVLPVWILPLPVPVQVPIGATAGRVSSAEKARARTWLS